MYAGPRYPGGPDSLQRVLRRAVRHAAPTLAGEVFLHLELDDKGQVKKSYILSPPAGSAAAKFASSAEASALAQQVTQQLPAWQLLPPAQYARDAYQAKTVLTLVTLPLGPGATAAALPYSEEAPLFTLPNAFKSAAFPFNLLESMQRQVRYPAQDLRNQVQGVVYAYFEVSETGKVEQRRIVGTVSPTLDAEVLRVLQQVPDAVAPPRQNGQPVRVSYVLPLNFKIM